MSLLVPDYSSSSEDEETLHGSDPTLPFVSIKSESSTHDLSSDPFNTVPHEIIPNKKHTKKKKNVKKPKTVLYLPPAIQKLLETGSNDDSLLLSDNSDEDNEILIKHKQAKRMRSKQMRPDTAEKQSILSFLPQPKHELLVLNHSNFYTEDAVEERKEEKNQRQDVQTDQQSSVEEASAAWQQYYQQQQQYQNSGAANLQEYYVAQGEDDVAGGSSKRRRTRERDIERALQDGHFETVAGQITDVHGVMPHAWQPPSNTLTGVNGSSDQQVKVKASFWNAQAGTMVSTVKPSRLQRQKHQLNQLAFDAKARDFELLEKRGTSLKTKRETYAKYGW